MTKFLPLGATAAATLLLSACSFVPAYERPAAPVAATYPGASTTAATSPAADIAWQDYFVDARLKRLIELKEPALAQRYLMPRGRSEDSTSSETG